MSDLSALIDRKLREIPPADDDVRQEPECVDLEYEKRKARIVTSVRKGNFESTACLAEGITKTDYQAACARDRKFTIGVLQAKAQCEQEWLNNAITTLDSSESKRWLDLLSRRFSARWDSSGGSRATGWETDELNEDPEVVRKAREKQRQKMGIAS